MPEEADKYTEEQIGNMPETSEEYGYLRTRIILGSKSSMELIREIENDTSHSSIVQHHEAWLIRAIIIATFFLLMSQTLFLILLDGTGNPVTVISLLSIPVSIVGIMGVFFLICYRIEEGSTGIMMNEVGIGQKRWVGLSAIEWQHVQWIDIFYRKKRIVKIQISGNRRRIVYQLRAMSGILEVEEIQHYLVDFSRWKKIKLGDSAIRYIRPSDLTLS